MKPNLRTILLPALASLALLTGCEYVEIDGVGTRTADDAHPPQSDVASFDGCETADLGRWRASGELVNNSESVASYEVVVAFYDGETRLDQRTEWIRDLQPGERAAIDRAWWLDDPDRVTDCRLILINRFG